MASILLLMLSALGVSCFIKVLISSERHIPSRDKSVYVPGE